jgi:hypothetical protein
MVLRVKPGLVQQDGDTPHNSGSQKFLEGVPPAKAMKVDVSDPHFQAKKEGSIYSQNAKHVVRSGGSAAELLGDKSK